MADDAGPGPGRQPRRRRRSESGSTSESTTAAQEPRSVPELRADATRTTEPTAPRPRPRPEPWLPIIDDRSPNEWVCPFLRSVDEDDVVGTPVEVPDASNRCAALREPIPQSLRQQELVCLNAGHVNCPRYLRGAVAVAELPAAAVRTGPSISPAVLGSVAVLLVAFVGSLGFVAARGSLELTPAATSGPSASASAVAAIDSPAPSVAVSLSPATPAPTGASPTPSPSPSSSPSPSPSPSPDPTPSASPTASPSPTSEPSPEPTAKPKPTSDRYALLRPCPDTPRCWIYTVRSGDNLYSIANYFGVSLQSIYDRNPWTRSRSLRAGQELRLPPPTR